MTRFLLSCLSNPISDLGVLAPPVDLWNSGKHLAGVHVHVQLCSTARDQKLHREPLNA